ncbi:MAG: serine/threonine protein kinase, partial [Phycisphaerales bacterium]
SGEPQDTADGQRRFGSDETQTASWAAIGGTPSGAPIPQRIGHYRIVRLIGEGGMALVFEAEQEHPQRRVALKLIKPGYASRESLRRFEQEAEVLGRLEHEGIARIYEAGTEDTGAGPQPYFAMEYLRGQNLREYANARNLGTRQRLELFAKVCDAVQHAHQKGIIHRDLKPGNIMVTEAGQPKVLDFGVARVTDSDVQTTTLRTDMGQLIGTVPYMSPEQVAADPLELDTRSDVYALGVVLYELLARRLPYDLRQRMIHEAVRVIREEDATPLSSVNRVFRGDVETIVAKALEKEKERRYQSALDFASDIRRYLSDEPIVARPASAMYQLGKFAKRNRVLVGGAAAVFVVLVLGVIGTGIGMARALAAEDLAERRLEEAQAARQAEMEERKRAEGEAAKAGAINTFLQDMLGSVEPSRALGREVTVRQVLDEAAGQIDRGSLQDQPEVEAAVRATLGNTYSALGLYPSGERQMRGALEIHQRLFGNEHRAVAADMNDLGVVLWRSGDYAEAEPLFRESLALRRKLLGEEHPSVALSMHNLGGLLRDQGDHAAAESLAREALAMRRRLLGDEHQDVAHSLHSLAVLLREKGDFDAAEPLFREALAMTRKLHGDVHPDVASHLDGLVSVLHAKGDYAAAESVAQETLAMHEELLGEAHPRTLAAMNALAAVYNDQGRYAEAEPLFLEVLDVRRRRLGEENVETLISMNDLAALYGRQDRFEEAEGLYQESLQIVRRVLGEEHPHTLATMGNLAVLYGRQGLYDKAEPLLVRTLEIRRKSGDEHPNTLIAMNNLAMLYKRQGRHDEAEALFREAMEGQRRVLSREHPSTLDTMENLAMLYADLGRQEESESLLLEALAVRRRLWGETHPATLYCLNNLAWLYNSERRFAEAEPLLAEAVEAVRSAEGGLPEGHWFTGVLLARYGVCLRGLDRYDEAESVLLEGHEILESARGPTHERTLGAVRSLVDLYDAWGKAEEAAAWRAELEARQAATQPAEE